MSDVLTAPARSGYGVGLLFPFSCFSEEILCKISKDINRINYRLKQEHVFLGFLSVTC